MRNNALLNGRHRLASCGKGNGVVCADGGICQPRAGGWVDYFVRAGVGAGGAIARWPGRPPSRCALCAAAARRVGLCAACAESLPVIDAACPVCGLAQERALPCGDCLRAPPAYARCIAALDYGYPVNRLVHLAKYHGRLDALDMLASRLAMRLRREETRPDCIVPVPLHSRRQRQRGYNQAGLVAAYLSRALNIPCRSDLLSRRRATREQAALRPAERRRNVRGAFHWRGRPGCAYIAVVDDVLTTGATGNEIARLLRRAGVGRVEIWALARSAGPD